MHFIKEILLKCFWNRGRKSMMIITHIQQNTSWNTPYLTNTLFREEEMMPLKNGLGSNIGKGDMLRPNKLIMKNERHIHSIIFITVWRSWNCIKKECIFVSRYIGYRMLTAVQIHNKIEVNGAQGIVRIFNSPNCTVSERDNFKVIMNREQPGSKHIIFPINCARFVVAFRFTHLTMTLPWKFLRTYYPRCYTLCMDLNHMIISDLEIWRPTEYDTCRSCISTPTSIQIPF